MTLRIEGSWFKDEHGRVVLLRGVNLAGSTKLPTTPDGATYKSEGFFQHRDVSFIGRPFPLEEADEHFSRLRAWGFTFLRFLVTWEAIEHAGTGQYDHAYLDYLQAVVEKAYEYDFKLFIDPHQDVWSRFSGGSGAPGWTFDTIGMDITRFKATGAAIVHQTHGDPLPQMIWPTNYNKLATATLFTLFFGGDDFAPLTRVDGEPIQSYLQRHYIAAIQQVAKRLKGMPHVIGYDTLNEPSRGYIECEDLNVTQVMARVEATPTPFQSMALGSGYAQTVENWWLRLVKKGTVTIDPQGKGVWKEGYECVWKQNGVWDVGPDGRPRLLRPHHFVYVDGRRVNFDQDYLRPFILRYTQGIREIDPTAMIFVENEYGAPPPYLAEDKLDNLVYAPHWYDAIMLLGKRYIPFLTLDTYSNRFVFGEKQAQQSRIAQLGRYQKWAQERMNGAPVLIGEIGIPYDMHNKSAYQTNDYSRQIAAYDALMSALDANLLNFTLWNYTPVNTNARGDLWNDEDLSLFSRDQQTHPEDIHSGGRALEAVVRPYAKAIAGQPLRQRFDRTRGVYEFTFRHDPAITEPTEFFVPNLQFPKGYYVELSDGDYTADTDNQRLIYRHSQRDIPHTVRIISQAPPATEEKARVPWWWALGLILMLWLLRRRKS